VASAHIERWTLVRDAIVVAITATGLLIALAATLEPNASGAGAPGTSLVVRVPDVVRMLVLGLLAVSTIILFALQRRDRRRPTEAELEHLREQRGLRSWAGALASLPLVLSIATLAYLVWHRSASAEDEPITAALGAIRRLIDLLARSRKPEASLPAFDVAVTVLVLGTALMVFTAVVLVAFADRLVGRGARAVPAPRGRTNAERADDPRAEPDARRAIVLAYRRFERALGAVRLSRAPSQTPSEFMREVVASAPVPRAPVERLTALFELARFSDRHVGAEARHGACDCLDAIEAALDAPAEREAPDAR
jgi:hypothetical protein